MPAKFCKITTFSHRDGSVGVRTIKMSKVKEVREYLAKSDIIITSSRPVQA